MSIIEILEHYDFTPDAAPGVGSRGTFLPGALAVETGVLAELEQKAEPMRTPIGVDLANNILPNADSDGLVDTGYDILALDLVSVEYVRPALFRVRPLSASNLAADGKIIGEAVVSATSVSHGWSRFIAAAVFANKKPGLADRLRRGRNPSRIGQGVTTFNAGALELQPKIEIVDHNLADRSYLSRMRES